MVYKEQLLKFGEVVVITQQLGTSHINTKTRVQMPKIESKWQVCLVVHL